MVVMVSCRRRSFLERVFLQSYIIRKDVFFLTVWARPWLISVTMTVVEGAYKPKPIQEVRNMLFNIAFRKILIFFRIIPLSVIRRETTQKSFNSSSQTNIFKLDDSIKSYPSFSF